MNRVINPYANKVSSTTDSATRRLNEAIVRLVFPLSLTRKKRPLARLISIPNMMTMMRKLSISYVAAVNNGVYRIKSL